VPNQPKQPLQSEKDLGEIEERILGRRLQKLAEELRRNPQPPAEKPTSQ
jgi:hypothetical protein